MRNSNMLKVICFLFIFVLIVTMLPINIVEAAEYRSCKYWLFSSNDTGSWRYRNKTLNVSTYQNNQNVTDISWLTDSANFSIEYESNPGNIEITPKEYYMIDLIELWNGNNREGAVKSNIYPNIEINSNKSKTLKIFIKDRSDNYYTLSNINSADFGNSVLRVNTYLDGIDANSLVYQESYITGSISNLTVNQNDKYVIDNIKFDGSVIENGNNNKTIGNGLTKELNIYLKTKPFMITENEYNLVYGNRESSGNKKFTVITYLDGTDSASIKATYTHMVDSSGVGIVKVEPKEGYNIHHIDYKGKTFTNESKISDTSSSENKFEIFMQGPTTNFAENDYIVAETERDQDSYGSKIVKFETYVDGTNNKISQDIVGKYGDNGAGKATITVKDGYSLHHINVGNKDYYSNTVDLQKSAATVKVYLQSTPANVTENEYIKISTGRDKDYYVSNNAKKIVATTYVDGKTTSAKVDTKTITYDSNGPGNITITTKEGYIIDSLVYNGVTYSNVTKVSFNYANNKNNIDIYLKSLKYLTVNYYYDGKMDSDKTYHEEKNPGDKITIQSNMIDNLVFQKATISNDDTVRTIDLNTKNVTLTMPNKSVTVEFFHVTEGDVLLSKKAVPVPGTINNFNIEIKAEGTPFVSSKYADIVLVFDKSGSMGNSLAGGKTRMTVLKEAADKFIDAVMPAGSISLNRVAIVAYSGNNPSVDAAYNDAYVLQEFTSSNTIAKNSYKGDKLKADGGTNNEAGFRTAREVMENSRDDVERYVIYMTDGEPTFYYSSTGKTEGNGSSYTEKAKNNAIAEALRLKNDVNRPAEIYTVALSPSNTDRIEQVLNPQGANKYQKGFYHATNANQLNAIYTLLATEISNEIASNAVIKDSLPEGFTFNPASLQPNDGSVTINNGILTWNLGKINVGEKKITINAQYTGNKYGTMYTNEECSIEYNHVNSKDVKTTKIFEKPLEAIVPVISSQNYEIGKDTSLTIDPKVYLNKVNQGMESGYEVADIEIMFDKQPTFGTLIVNDDGTITYKPNSGYTGKDDFVYTVSMTITNEQGDPFDIVGTYTNDVNVTVNIVNKYELRVRYLYDGKSISPDKVSYYYANTSIGATALDVSGYRFVRTQHSGVVGAKISDKNITGIMPALNTSIDFIYEKNDYSYKVEYYYDGVIDNAKTFIGSASEGTVINSYEEKIKSGYTFIRDTSPMTVSKDENSNVIKVYYVKIENDLKSHTMYDRNKLEPINNLNIIKDFDYTFGFRFKSGQNGTMAIQLQTDLSQLNIRDFSLYDAGKNKMLEGIIEVSRTSNTISLETTSLEYGKEYLVIYHVKGNAGNSNVSVKLLNLYLIDNGKNPININIMQPGLK